MGSVICSCFLLLGRNNSIRLELADISRVLGTAWRRPILPCGEPSSTLTGASGAYRAAVEKHGIRQSMNSDGGCCHDNARCESMWARMKTELFYGRIEPESMTVEQLKALIWRYFISYWNRRRICSANDGLPPVVKRQRYFAALDAAA